MDLTGYLIYIIEAAAAAVILGAGAIPLARKYKARQSIREEGPKSHRLKAGTPTMGGLFMMLAAVLVIVLLLVLITLGHALLGFLDDFIKAEKKRNLGLTVKQKMAGQLLLSILFCYGCVEYLGLPSSIAIPFTETDISIGWLYYPFVVLVSFWSSSEHRTR